MVNVVQFDALIKNVELIRRQHLAFPMGVTCGGERRGGEVGGEGRRAKEDERGGEVFVILCVK